MGIFNCEVMDRVRAAGLNEEEGVYDLMAMIAQRNVTEKADDVDRR